MGGLLKACPSEYDDTQLNCLRKGFLDWIGSVAWKRRQRHLRKSSN